MEKQRILLDFSSEAEVARWKPVDDRVMGGTSRSAMTHSANEIGIFAGHLSLEQGGGFASVRASVVELNLRDCNDLCLRVRGDGKRYKLILGTTSAPGGVRYQQSFATKAETWETVRLPLQEFSPKYRGQFAQTAEALNAVAIDSIGLMISDRQDGNFRLEVASIMCCHV